MKRTFQALFLLGLGLSLGGAAAQAAPLCASALTGAADSAKRAQCEKPWTILIHMAADNNLAPYAFWDLFEIESLGSTKNLDVVVQLDLPGADGIRQFHMTKSERAFSPHWGPKDFAQTRPDELSSRLIRKLDETGSVSEEKRVREFLSSALKAFPSKRIMVVVWGHGEGWTAADRARANRTGGIGMNDTTKRYLSIPALKRALDASAKTSRAGLPADLVVTDACLMQMAEVVTELEGSARYLVGSSQNQDVLGIPYRALLRAMNSGKYPAGSRAAGGDEAFFLAQMIPDLMHDFMEKAAKAGLTTEVRAREMGMSSVTLAEWNLAFLPAFRSFADELLAEAKTNEKVRIAFELAVTDNLVFDNGSAELGIFLRSLYVRLKDQGYGIESTLLAKNRAAQSALDRAVTAYSLGDEMQGLGKRSVSLWIPLDQDDYSERIKDFRKSKFYPASNWGKFLDLAFAAN